MTVRAAVALGSNLGDRLGFLQAGVDGLAATAGCSVVAVSPVYETDPVGGPDQPAYLNAVLLVDTVLGADGLLARAQQVEAAAARVRAQRWGPRTLDLDILSFGELTSADETLTLPHPRARERAFVLAPWHDVDDNAVIPGRGRVADLLRSVGPGGVHRRDDLELRLTP